LLLSFGDQGRDAATGTRVALAPPEVRLRIDRTEDAGVVTLRVAGWLDGGGVEELERACAGASPHVRLDLSELRSTDPGGIDALLGLEHAGAELIGVPPYIRLLLSTRGQGGKPEPGGRR
jgi:hypothetical protein